jgi:hypothetical protein
MAPGLALLATIVLAGCGGGSMLPGQGGSSGLGTPGTDTGNPDATFSFSMRGSTLGDFKATDVKPSTSVLGFQIQGSSSSGPASGSVLRTATVRVNGLPVANTTYTVGGTDSTGAAVIYTEKNQQTGTITVWNGSSGSVYITSVTSTHVNATFNAKLDPGQNATGPASITGGIIHVLYQQTQ